MIDPQLSGKNAIVTGINNPMGIGAETARALCAQGVRVFGTYVCGAVTPEQSAVAAGGVGGEALYRALAAKDAGDVVGAIRATGGEVEAIEADLADAASPAAIFDAAEAAFGPVEILVCNAAYSEADSLLPDDAIAGRASAGAMPIAGFSVDRHDRHFQVNVRATALLMREFARRQIARGGTWGRIITVSTDASSCFPTEVSYGVSKYALESLTRAAAAEFGALGITCNIVAPGPVQSGYIPPEAEPRIVAGTPLGRVGEPADVADVIVLLASEQARWLTGQLLYVGGGHRM